MAYTGVATDKVINLTASLTPASTGAATIAEQTFTLTGVQLGDVVVVNGPQITAGVSPVAVRVSALNQVAIAFSNPTAGALTAAAGTYRFAVIRP